MHESPLPRIPAPPTTVPPPPSPQPAGRRPRRWPWILAAGVLAAIIAAAAWWLIATTVPESTYDEATAELAAADDDVAQLELDVTSLESTVASLQDQVASVEADKRELTTDGAALRAEIERLTGEAAALRDAAALALVAAEAQAHDSLNTGAELSAQLEAAGADFTDADALLAELGHDGAFTDWATRDESFLATDRAVAAVNDDRLWDAWQRWYDAEIGSPQEQAAYLEYVWRLHRLVVEALGDIQQ